MSTTEEVVASLRAALQSYEEALATPITSMEEFDRREQTWALLKESFEMLRVYLEATAEAAELRGLYNRTGNTHDEEQRAFKLSPDYVWKPQSRNDPMQRLLQNVDAWVLKASTWPPEYHPEDADDYAHFLSARDGIEQGFRQFDDKLNLRPLHALVAWADETIRAQSNNGIDERLASEMQQHRANTSVPATSWWWYLDQR